MSEVLVFIRGMETDVLMELYAIPRSGINEALPVQ
jgi:hypothetical protein